MRRSLLIILVMLLCISLSLDARTTSASKLKTNLENWQQFRWQGIIQVQSSAFSLRKNFVLAKTEEALRLDILDSGIMGLQAQPVVSLYLKDTAILNAPTIEQLQGIDLNWFLPKGAVQSLVHFTDSLLVKQKDILAKRKVTTGKTEYSFDSKYRLKEITSPASGFKSSITYNNSGQPSKITVEYSGKQVAELLINEREYSDIKIVPLEASPDSLNLEELMKAVNPDSLDLDDLLKGTDLEGLELEPE